MAGVEREQPGVAPGDVLIFGERRTRLLGAGG